MFKPLFLASFLLASMAAAATACSCNTPSIEAAFEASTDVFLAKAIGVEIDQPACLGFGGVRLTFEKSRYWKGDDGNIAHVHTECSSASCGFEFMLNEEYVVFSAFNGSLQALHTHLCSGTIGLAYAGETLGFLGAGLTPVATEDTSWSAIKAKF